jgi:hypothetical protein
MPRRKADVHRLWNILPELTTELTDEDKKKGSTTTMNSSQEDCELENLLSQIVDGELQVVIDDVNEAAATEESTVEEVNVDAVADNLGQAVARLGEDNEEDKNEDTLEELEENDLLAPKVWGAGWRTDKANRGAT